MWPLLIDVFWVVAVLVILAALLGVSGLIAIACAAASTQNPMWMLDNNGGTNDADDDDDESVNGLRREYITMHPTWDDNTSL